MTRSLPEVPAKPLQVSDETLPATLASWGFPAGTSLAKICESENVTCLASTPDGCRAVVRLHRPDYNDAAEIRSEHAWIDALRQSGTVPTPAVLRRCDGETLGTVRVGDARRHVAAFEFMEGREPAADDDLPLWFGRLGELTARLHRQSRAWERPPAFRRKRWTFRTTLGTDPHWGDWRKAVGLDSDGRRLLSRAAETVRATLAAYGTGPDRFGLIHADLRPANLLVDGDRLGVIDFDDCGFGWFLYDFAASVSFIEHEPIVEDLREAWLAGYRALAPVTDRDAAMLDVFVMLRRILLTAWVASRPVSDIATAFGAPFTAGTAALAERFLSAGGQRG